jgi:hypothetical protein
MMDNTLKIITEYGVLIVIAATFIAGVAYAFRWWLKSIECMKEDHTKAVEGFIETSNEFAKLTADFTTVVGNHLDHQNECMDRLNDTMTKICTMVEILMRSNS